MPVRGALTAAIMCMGVATANSVLVVSFARERLDALGDPEASAADTKARVCARLNCRAVRTEALDVGR